MTPLNATLIAYRAGWHYGNLHWQETNCWCEISWAYNPSARNCAWAFYHGVRQGRLDRESVWH